ncbi:hypothetical protein [Bacteroides sp.]|uniref:hypothetical protein n=1 Tax=Bacteroides sp. TaxID=29523 RepID=UPI00260E2BCC|nr:hypothetical protein [Bacteroides sp.]
MKTKEKHLLLLSFLFLAACNSSEVIEKFPVVENKYDPSQPKEVTDMKPLTGRIDDSFIIEGNLGANIDDMRVYFGDKKALLLRTDGHALHGIVPKQPDGYNRMTVVLGEDSIVTDLIYRYRQNQYIVTITGKMEEISNWTAGSDGPCKDGSLGDATFTYMRGITIVAGGNILEASGKNSFRLVSLEDEKVATIYGFWGQSLGEGAASQTGEEAYFINVDNRRLFKATRSGGWVPIQVRGDTPELSGKVMSITYGADWRYLYARDQNGNFGRFDLETEGIPFELLTQTEGGGDEQTRMCYCKYSDCFYATWRNQHGVIKIWQDKTTNEWKSERYAGFNASGSSGGDRLKEAQFTEPVGICADSEGNVYVGNIGNSIIQKIWLKSGFVEHVAGVSHAPWDIRPTLNGKPLESVFYLPVSIKLDADENFIIAGMDEGQIRKYAIE